MRYVELDHQRVGVAAGLHQIVGLACIPDHHQLCPSLERPQHFLRRHAPAVRQCQGLSFHEVPALRSKRNTQFVRLLRQERAACPLFKDVAKTIRAAVRDGKRRYGEVLGLEEHARLDLAELQRHGGLIPAQHDPVKQVMHAVESRAAAEDLKLLDCLPAQERAQQPAQAQNMVKVAMGQKHSRQVPKTDTRLQDLPLGALAAVDQEAVLVVLDDLRRKPAPRRWRGRRRAKE